MSSELDSRVARARRTVPPERASLPGWPGEGIDHTVRVSVLLSRVALATYRTRQIRDASDEGPERERPCCG